MHIEARGLIYDAPKRSPNWRVAFFDGLCPLTSGAWLSGFTIGREKHALDGTIMLCRSADGGATWRDVSWTFETQLDGVPGSLAGAEVVEVAPGRLLIATTWFDRSDPTRPLFDPVTEGVLHSRLLIAESADDGETWGPWGVVPTQGLTGCALTGPFAQWGGERIALAFESFKEFDDPSPAQHAAWLLPSSDGGRTFGAPVLVAPRHHVYYWDQRVVAQPGDAYTALFWTHDREQKKDLHVHFSQGAIGGGSAPAPSPAPPSDTRIPGQIAAPLVLADGRILAFVVDRDRPGTMTLWQSRDGGATWPAAEKLVVHEQQERAALTQGKDNIDFAQYWEDMGKWSFGHPTLKHFDDGRVLASWYAGEPGCLSVHWARIAI